MKKLLGILLAVSLIFSLAACGGSSGDNGQSAGESSANNGGDTQDDAAASDENIVVKLGVVGENNEYWEPVIANLAEQGITLEFVKFSEYSLPNQAVADSEIDMNSFQHYAFLNEEIANKGFDLSVIAETFIAPMGLYSSSITSLEELQDGDSIAIPSDATNGGRALKVLEAAGLIEVDPAAGYVPELKDITSNPLNITFYEVEAAQTASLMQDVAASIISVHYAVDAGLNPQTDSLYLETPQEGVENPYINIIVVRTEELENETYLKVVEAFQTEEVAQALEELYQGAYIPVWS